MHQRIKAVHDLLTGGAASVAPFVEAFLAEFDDRELASRNSAALANALSAHAELGAVRRRGEVLVSVHRPVSSDAGHSRAWLQTVTDDSPFLVDSICSAVRDVGFDVDLLMHPVLGVDRSADGAVARFHPSQGSRSGHVDRYESWVQIELGRVPTDAECTVLIAAVQVALADVAAAVGDWPQMQQRVHVIAGEVRFDTPALPGRQVDPDEAATFLEWLLLGHFTFLGAIDHELVNGNSLQPVAGSALGILRDNHHGTPRSDIIAPSGDWSARQVVLVTKTIAFSKVHRHANYDIVIVKRYAPANTGIAGLPSVPGGPAETAATLIGERRIVGLFTSEAVLTSPLDTPLLRGKVGSILSRSGLSPSSYSGKELRSILTTHPRDELFAATEDELSETVMGVLAIGERRRTRLFARFDRERGAWTCQVYLPRDRYNTDVRLRIQARLDHEFHSAGSTFTTQLSDSRLARLVFTLPSADPSIPNLITLEADVANMSRSWSDALGEALIETHDAETPLAERYKNAFPPAYTAETPIGQALDDIVWCERALTSSGVVVRVHANSSEDTTSADARLSVYSPERSIALADMLPVLSNLGLRVIDEKADEVEISDDLRRDRTIWIHDLGVCGKGLSAIDPSGPDAARLCEAVIQAWTGQVDNDGFNQLVTVAGLTSFQANVLRFYARHARQLGLSSTLEYVMAALMEHPSLARALAERFELMFDPDRGPGQQADTARCEADDARRADAATLSSAFSESLAEVPNLDHDRIFRMISAQIDASVRTNAYRAGTAALAVKFETRRIPGAPQPQPLFEIFVASPRVEGAHLRMGAVARGGLRWSDRPEDFRTEVLGLMKAQAVKNAVIVPAGAKGGFVVRNLPASTDRSALQAEGIACYQIFIGALLDLTDNLIGGATIAPTRVVRWDGDDPYLVVAADKGTATFSDIANQISLERGHWLGDAFASGGSVGYDHKAMGITARGAWESVKRHFLRLGTDITAPGTDAFTVIGVGDMSGDVFGNGVILSDRIRLIAAFDHRHIFIDPDPDPASSFQERVRLFGLARSSWEDYNPALISAGGGVWPRTAKSIRVSPQAATVLGLTTDGIGGTSGAAGTAAAHEPAQTIDMAPTELLRAILRAPAALLWNGGIGTYVKASTETHAQVGDKANDTIRADATELRVNIVGEGGNLGVTQRGRVEFAGRLRHEPVNQIGWINTDAIDNSAGVDTSDHEVNLKILLDPLVRSGRIDEDGRNRLLASVTDEVAALVLADNIDQNRLLGNLLTESPGMIDLHARYVTHLEETGRIDRALEALPSVDGFAARKAAGAGLTIPELAVLVAQTKLAITEALASAQLADEPAFHSDLLGYFPNRIAHDFSDAVVTHPLRHEIVATVRANRLVNRNGVSFVYRMQSETHSEVADIVRAHMAATAILDIDSYWEGVISLDGKRPDAEVVQLLLEADRAVERTTRWLLRNRTLPLDVQAIVDTYGAAIVELSGLLDGLVSRGGLPGSDGEALLQRQARFAAAGLPETLARRGAQLELATSLLDVVVISESTGVSRNLAGEVLLGLDDSLLIGRLRRRILRLPRENEWDALARASLRDDLAGEHMALTRSVLSSSDAPGAEERISAWTAQRIQAIERHLAMVDDTESVDGSQLAALSVALRQLRTLSVQRIG